MKDKRKGQAKVYQSLALITQFGLTMIVPIFLCSFLGWYLDQKFHTDYLFIVLFFVGALAGFRNIFILARKVYESGDEKEQSYEELRSAIARKQECNNQDGDNRQINQKYLGKKGDGRNEQNSRH